MSAQDEPPLDEPALQALVRRQNQAFDDAEHGVGAVPDYRVSTDPADDAFVVVMPDDLSTVDRARVAGDVRRRFIAIVTTGEDAFDGLRVPWPEGGLP